MILGRAQNKNGDIVILTETKLGNNIDITTTQRCTGLLDNNKKFIYEGDYITDFDAFGKPYMSGYVKYNPTITAFILVDCFGKEISGDTLGRLIWCRKAIIEHKKSKYVRL